MVATGAIGNGLLMQGVVKGYRADPRGRAFSAGNSGAGRVIRRQQDGVGLPHQKSRPCGRSGISGLTGFIMAASALHRTCGLRSSGQGKMTGQAAFMGNLVKAHAGKGNAGFGPCLVTRAAGISRQFGRRKLFHRMVATSADRREPLGKAVALRSIFGRLKHYRRIDMAEVQSRVQPAVGPGFLSPAPGSAGMATPAFRLCGSGGKPLLFHPFMATKTAFMKKALHCSNGGIGRSIS